MDLLLLLARRLAPLLMTAPLLLAAGASTAGVSPELRVNGMTFVGSRGSINEFVLRAERAIFLPDTDLAKLEAVEVTATNQEKGQSFELTCDRGELNVRTNDFRAEGNVEGVNGDGQHYETSWVEYDHEQAMLFTDATVLMVDDSGTFRGDGFRYYVKERRFQLLGNVSVVQTP